MSLEDGSTEPPSLKIVLGTAQWGAPYGIANRTGVPETHVVAELLDMASAYGISTLDTARGYGESEAVIGEALRERDGSVWQIVTKIDPHVYRPGFTTAQALAKTGRSLANSRACLGRSVLDVVLLHRGAHRHACNGALWRRLVQEREQGLIGALGVSAANPEEAWAMLADPEVEVLQVAASLLDQRLAREHFFETARDSGKKIYVRSVFLQGLAFLSPRALPPHLRPFSNPLSKIRGWAMARQCSVADIFLNYVASLPGVTAVIGSETAAQLREILRACASPGTNLTSVRRLASQVAPLPDKLLDPSRWNQASKPRLTPTRASAPAPG